jgi:hypothetical protein
MFLEDKLPYFLFGDNPNDASYCGIIEEPRQPCSLNVSGSTIVASVVQVFTTLLIVV